jgi:hypothetical protein
MVHYRIHKSSPLAPHILIQINPVLILISCSFETHFNPLKPSGYYMYHLLSHTKTLHSAHTSICVVRLVLTINSATDPIDCASSIRLGDEIPQGRLTGTGYVRLQIAA